MGENKYVLAMYDVRGKQEFIFRTNKLQEIVGGSWIIRDIFDDYLFNSAKSIRTDGGNKGIFYYKDPELREKYDVSFTQSNFADHLSEGYIGEVVYDGGGNFIVLFKNEKVFQTVTYEFTKVIMKNIGTLRVLATCTPVSDEGACDHAFLGNYIADSINLYEKHRINEAQESNITPWSCIPIVQVDRKTSQPLIDYTELLNEIAGIQKWPEDKKNKIEETIGSKGEKGKLSKERFAKLLKYHSEIYRISKEKESYDKLTKLEQEFYRNNENILDRLVEQKGVDSNLAVIYIDGNSMGAKVESATKGKKNYEESIKALRAFSSEIQKIYVEDGVEKALEDVCGDSDTSGFRLVVSAGDEINFIVKAKDAFKCAKGYLDFLRTKDNASACAGIAVFNSHSPYAKAYQLAEEACESGKQKMKEAGLECASFIDFHICQGAIGTTLETIRRSENGNIISRPWMMWNDGKISDASIILNDYDQTIVKWLSFLKAFSRTNIKGILSASKEGLVPLKMELNRMYAHADMNKKEEWEKGWDFLQEELSNDEERVRGIIYDIVLVYDLWFGEEVSR